MSLPDPTRKPELQVVIDNALRRYMLGVHTAIPAVVTAYNPANQTCDVQPAVQAKDLDFNAEVTTKSYAAIKGVPVAWPGGGGFRLTFPLAAGDSVMLVFQEWSIDSWSQGDGSEPIDPGDTRRFNLADAVAIPCLTPLGRVWKTAGSSSATLGQDAGPQVVVRPSGVELGGDESTAPTDFVALASLVLGNLNALKTAINGWTPVAGDGGAALKTALTALFAAPWPTSVSAVTKAK